MCITVLVDVHTIVSVHAQDATAFQTVRARGIGRASESAHDISEPILGTRHRQWLTPVTEDRFETFSLTFEVQCKLR